MVANLASRGIELQTLRKYGSFAAQKERLRAYGFGGGTLAGGGIGVADVNFLWEREVNQEEKGRVAGLEMVDELEEWRLLAGHYCVVWGWRDENGGADGKPSETVWARWRDVNSQV